jgi:Ferredoxin-dependent bilin reductase
MSLAAESAFVPVTPRVSQFEQLAALTLALASQHGFKNRPVASDLQVLNAALPSGPVTMTTTRVVAEGLGDLRIMHLLSLKADVVSMFLLPAPSRALPLYAMEFVQLGGKPILGVIDALSKCGANDVDALTASIMRDAHKRFPTPQADDRPDWFVECRSGDDIYVRPEAVADFGALSAAHLWIVEKLFAWYTADILEDSGTGVLQHAEALQAYMSHHAVHSPGRPLLKRSFGEPLAERYLTQCLFKCDLS